MNARKGLVLDANILIRAVFGQRVRQILEAYENVASFCSRRRNEETYYWMAFLDF